MRVVELYYVARRLRSWLEDCIAQDLDRHTPLYLWIVVRDVLESPGTTIRDIGQRLRMAQSMVSKAVTVAERRGWVQRRVDAQDRRRVRVFPAEDLLGRIQQGLNRTLDEAMDDLFDAALPPADRLHVARTFELLHARFKELDDRRGGHL